MMLGKPLVIASIACAVPLVALTAFEVDFQIEKASVVSVNPA
jgi:hypothetical protein